MPCAIESQLQPGEEILYRAYVTRLTLAPLVAVAAAAPGDRGGRLVPVPELARRRWPASPWRRSPG